MSPDSAPLPPTVPRLILNRVTVTATVAGNALEFYDFLAYSTFAVYIGHAFFPTGNAFSSLLLTLATFGVGFFTRPLGAAWIGAYADRVGRRPALTLTIILMSVGTLGLVLTPSYALIGPAAPVILVTARLLQGLALGGEVGASTAVLFEGAPSGKKGLFVSWQFASQGVAILSAGLVGFGLSTVLSKQQLGDWGWRVPFALGLTIIPVGIYIRRRLPETLEAPGSRGSAAVLGVLWGQHRKSMVLAVLTIMCTTISTYVTNYMTTYALTALGMPASKAIIATIANGTFIAIGALWGGRLTDRFGYGRLMIFPRLALMLAVYPAFMILVSFRTAGVLVVVTSVLTLLGTLTQPALLTALSDVFPNHVRGSGLAISYALSVGLFGGTTQFIVAWLIGTTGDPLSPAYYVILTSIVGVWAMFTLTKAGSRIEAGGEKAADVNAA
jgi:MFS family permease